MRGAIHNSWRVALLTVGVVLVVAGCDSTPPSDATLVVVRQSVRPTLTASTAPTMSLFGGLPGRDSVPYSGRSRGSMLQHSFTREGGDFDCQVDGTGTKFVFASTRHSETPDIYMKSLGGTAVMQVTSDPSADVHPSLSPDGRRLAFASNRTGNWDIWIVSLDGQLPVQVTSTPMDEVHPSWSSDGATLVYSALPRASGQWELWITSAQAGTASTFIGYGLFPEWSPVDDRILFQRARERGSRWFSVWTIQMIDGEPRYPTEVASSSDVAMILPAWSRDGRHIAYTAATNLPPIDPEFGSMYEASDIWVMDANGGNRVRLTDGHSVNFMPAWTPDGRVLFTSMRAGHENIWSVLPTVDGAPPPTADAPFPTSVTSMPADGEATVIQTRSPAADR